MPVLDTGVSRPIQLPEFRAIAGFQDPLQKKGQAKKRHERKSHPSKNVRVRAFAGDHCKTRSEASQSTRQAILNFGYGAVRSSETFPMSAFWLSYDDLSCRVTCLLCISCARFYHRILPPGWACAIVHPLQIQKSENQIFHIKNCYRIWNLEFPIQEPKSKIRDPNAPGPPHSMAQKGKS